MIGLKFLKNMSKYKRVKIPKKNLPDSVDSKEFKELWLKCLSDKNSDLTNFILSIKPFVDRTVKQLKNIKPYDYFLISLLGYIDKNPNIALSKLKYWVKNSDIESELYFIIIDRIRSLKKIPYKARPLMAEYYFVLDFKYALSKQIKKTKQIKITNTVKNNYSIQLNDFYFTGNKWYDYIIMLHLSGYTVTEISNLTKLSRKTIIKEGEKIWQCLKQKQ